MVEFVLYQLTTLCIVATFFLEAVLKLEGEFLSEVCICM